MVYKAFICGLEGAALSAAEISFLRRERPCGVILFRRNCETPEGVLALTQSLRRLFEDERYPILIDQEGGRVQRLAAPHWRVYPPGRAFSAIYAKAPERALQAAYDGARLIAADLRAAGVNVNCAPVLDIPAQGAHDVIGDRAYGWDAATVIALAGAVAQGYLDGGVLPVIKHIPGHGRAGADSHFALPSITAPLSALRETDFEPFRALSALPAAMTAHVLIPEIDPVHPASASPAIIGGVIRGEIGFDGLLMCDDVSMGALSGGIAQRTRAVLAAGCDAALHCNGHLAEMEAVASEAPGLEGHALRRYLAALDRLAPPEPADMDAIFVNFGETLAEFA